MSDPTANPIVDPRAVRVTLAPTMVGVDDRPIVIEPAAIPLAPAPHLAGTGVLGGVAEPPPFLQPASDDRDGMVLVDGTPSAARLERRDELHAVLVEDEPGASRRQRVILMPLDPVTATGDRTRREVIVDGWRIEVEVESERRASLLERARRGREATAHGGPTEVRAIIPGRVVSVSIVAGDAVVAGQQLLVVEAMKMQNELRAPRDGVVSSVAVGAGGTIDVGDLLLVLE
jgi:biotin carboxyl carrier protein